MEREYHVVWGGGAERRDDLARHAQPFVAPLLAGGTLDASRFIGRSGVVLAFWASWCKPCVAEAPQLARLHQAYASRGVTFIAVSIDEKSDYETLRKTVSDLGLPYAVALDPTGAVLRQYARGASIPLTFVIDAHGDVVYAHQNFTPGDELALEQAIRSVAEPAE